MNLCVEIAATEIWTRIFWLQIFIWNEFRGKCGNVYVFLFIFVSVFDTYTHTYTLILIFDVCWGCVPSAMHATHILKIVNNNKIAAQNILFTEKYSR